MRKALMRCLIVAVFTSMAITLSACNTVEGAGKDTERAGEKIQDAADRNK
jgi:entericidin A